MIKYAVMLLVLLAVAACSPEPPVEASASPPTAPEPAPPATVDAGLEPGWNVISPGGETTCSDGSDYHFFVRPGDPERLLFYLQGGGACWNAETCAQHLVGSYKPGVAPDEPERYHGIFAFDHPDNPFRDYSVVMAPYCTGDVHLGNNVATYDVPATEEHPAEHLRIHHKGLVNAGAALDWTYRHLPDAREIFVTGSSAGAIPAPYYAWKIADQYPNARIRQLGDGAGGYRRDGDNAATLMASWGTLDHLARYPEYADVAPGEFTYESLYINAARRHPAILFTQFDNAEDAVQKRFLDLSGRDRTDLRPLLEANHADIRAAIDNFRAYIAGGDAHTILARPEFYMLHVGGVGIRDWVAALAADQPVDDVACSDCARAEGVPPPEAEAPPAD